MSEAEYERIAKLAYEDAIRRYGAHVPVHAWEKQQPDVHAQWVACVKLVERELLMGQHEKANQSFANMALQTEVARLKALARKYSNMIGDSAPSGYPAHQDRLREIEGEQP